MSRNRRKRRQDGRSGQGAGDESPIAPESLRAALQRELAEIAREALEAEENNPFYALARVEQVILFRTANDPAFRALLAGAGRDRRRAGVFGADRVAVQRPPV